MPTNKQHYPYMLGKLSSAVERLVIGEGDARSRLLWASEYLSMVQSSMLPPELHKKWDSINKHLTKYPASDKYSAMESTLRRIKNSTASNIAGEILSLTCELKYYCSCS